MFQGILRQAYADIFSVIQPETATDSDYDRAFRPYIPGGQRGRMITLFLGLCREAGIQTNVQPADRNTQRPQASGARVAKAGVQTKRGNAEGGKPPLIPPTTTDNLSAIREQYAKLLLDKVQSADAEDVGELMNRLERVLGATGTESPE